MRIPHNGRRCQQCVFPHLKCYRSCYGSLK